MWEGFIGQQIRRCNRNLLIWNVAILAGCAAIAALNFQYLSNWVKGTAPTDPQVIAKLRGPDELQRNFVSFDVPKVFESGMREEETENGRDTGRVTADFEVVWVGDKALVVKAAPGTTSVTHIEGELVAMPADLEAKLKQDLSAEDQAAILPFMLDAKDYRDNGWWLLGIGIPIVLLCVWNLAKWAKRSSDPASSPIVKRLGGEQGVLAIGQQLDIEMMGGTERFGAATVSPSFLLRPSVFDANIVRLEELVWIHKKVTQHRVNFVPTGKTYEVLLYTRKGTTCPVNGKEAQVNELLEKLASRYPWIIAGWSAELEATWKKNAAALIAAVDQRRGQAKGAAAGS
jgi:hypothetical protein